MLHKSIHGQTLIVPAAEQVAQPVVHMLKLWQRLIMSHQNPLGLGLVRIEVQLHVVQKVLLTLTPTIVIVAAILDEPASPVDDGGHSEA